MNLQQKNHDVRVGTLCHPGGGRGEGRGVRGLLLACCVTGGEGAAACMPCHHNTWLPSCHGHQRKLPSPHVHAPPPSSAAVPSCPTQLSSSTQLSHPAQQQYPAVPLSSAPHPQAVQREEQGRQLVASCEAELVAVRQKLRSQLAQRPAVAGGRWAAA